MVGVGLVFEVVSQMRAPRPASFRSRLGIEITRVESAFIMSTRRWLWLVPVFMVMPAPQNPENHKTVIFWGQMVVGCARLG